MPMFTCEGCRGVYDVALPDGTAYFHVCPPAVWVRATLENGQENERPLEGWQGFTLVPDQAAKDALVAEGANPHTIAIELARSERVRAGHRDENTQARAGKDGEERVIKHEGAGRTPHVPGPHPAEAPRDAA